MKPMDKSLETALRTGTATHGQQIKAADEIAHQRKALSTAHNALQAVQGALPYNDRGNAAEARVSAALHEIRTRPKASDKSSKGTE